MTDFFGCPYRSNGIKTRLGSPVPLEEVDPGTSSETVETSADANKALGKSEDEKVQVESPIEDLITREISVEEESSKETTFEEESPVDTISTEETVQRENVIHKKSPVMFDSKNELDTEVLPEELSVEISVAMQSTTADTEALYEEPANVSVKPCVEVTSQTLPDDDDVYLTPVDVLDQVASAASSEFCEWIQVGIDLYIPHCKYQVKPHSSPWFSAACGAALVHINFSCVPSE